uniref:Uncharacterized protein n=1 Tax=Arundo donax TaxID=35708 RepID=A0A0A9ED41_ARUDO
MNFQSSRSQQSFIKQIFPIRHSNKQNIV